MNVPELNKTFTDRELKLMINVLDYTNGDSQAGLPGHNLIVIIGKLLEVIDISENNIRDAITENEIPF